MADAIRECLAVREEQNLPLRVDLHDVEVTV
jgi:hypothetical protein